MVVPPVRALLIDLSGTLHIGKDALPGAVNALRRARQAGIPVRFCSNTSKESTSSLVKSLDKMGFEIQLHEVFTSLGAAREIVRKQKLNPFFLISTSAMEEFPEHKRSHNVYNHDAVVIGLAPEELSYENMNVAFRILTGERPNDTTACGKDRVHKPAPLIAMHRASYVRSPDGALSLGPGPFVAALETAANVKAHILGKPTRQFFETTLESLSRDGIEKEVWMNAHPGHSDSPSRCIVIIGDDINNDLGEGAIELNLRRVLVRTGKYRKGDEEKGGPDVPRPETFDSFAHFVDAMLGRESP
ncbi:Haloacid dehalogenase-like hydrolase domain-containing protein 2 OS=Bos taurus GN=HDHD2 PE=2 SV=1 [Rhizoctonia solani AG-1 IB]|uniref:Haloacid dehalogenase-like hydrolase domain-containing protein 2 n=1 Tax=Thanatephorus cucumeris (strain AG1-IB / isolate 7/3/14) TaxID=1108050 RepID=A0A0B7FJT2_THACB|nr:Haloacid dehalogenase-like hydrolase domain-containing protein 2 OS=Bos taurus GN=HDHD2 PE=2 SV=1 [Rhizoctonia solani AG-1 IB]